MALLFHPSGRPVTWQWSEGNGSKEIRVPSTLWAIVCRSEDEYLPSILRGEEDSLNVPEALVYIVSRYTADWRV